MKLLVKGNREGRDIVAVTPQSAGWKFVGFAAHRLQAGERIDVHLPEREWYFRNDPAHEWLLKD